MQLETRIATSTAGVDRTEWDRLSANRPFASYNWYRMGEVVFNSARRWYVLIYDGGENIARATFWLSYNEPLPISSAFERLAVSILLSLRPMLICRSPLADWTGLILPDDSRRTEALRLICSVAAEIAATNHASFTTFDYLDPILLGEDWQSLRFSRMDIDDPGTCLSIEFSSFDDYLRILSKSAKKDYRRHTNQANAREIHIEVLDRVSDLEAALPLIRTVENRHGAMNKPWSRALLKYGSAGGISWISARQNGRLIGCGMILKDQDVHLATLLGLDYRVEYVYFQLMYAAIKNAIEKGALSLRAGSGAYSLKKQLGFQLEDNHHLIFSGNGAFFVQLGRKLSDHQNE